jgi:hypothetical protein
MKRLKRVYFYVYEHWRPDLNLPFWVGKGKGRRAQIFKRGKNKTYNGIVDTLSRLGMCVEVKMVESSLPQREAFALEKVRIAFWLSRGVQLANIAKGGQGSSGWHHTEKWKRENSKRVKGRKDSKKTREKKRKAAQNRTPEHLANLSKALLGRPLSQEHCEKLSVAHANVPLSKAHRKSLGLVRKDTCWINNGKECRRIKKDESPPAGWVFGRLFKTKQRKPRSDIGSCWITDGKRNKRVKSRRSKVPKGWHFGYTAKSGGPTGKRWITDGVQNRFLPEGDPLPKGWRFGHSIKTVVSTD